MGDQYYPRFGRKNGKTWDNGEQQFDFPQIIPESQTLCMNNFENSRENIKLFVDVHQGPI
jgi:hypothetical protein